MEWNIINAKTYAIAQSAVGYMRTRYINYDTKAETHTRPYDAMFGHGVNAPVGVLGGSSRVSKTDMIAAAHELNVAGVWAHLYLCLEALENKYARVEGYPVHLQHIIDIKRTRKGIEDEVIFPDYPIKVMAMTQEEQASLGFTREMQLKVAYSIDPERLFPTTGIAGKTLDVCTRMPGDVNSRFAQVVTRWVRMLFSFVMFFTPKRMRSAAASNYMTGRVIEGQSDKQIKEAKGKATYLMSIVERVHFLKYCKGEVDDIPPLDLEMEVEKEETFWHGDREVTSCGTAWDDNVQVAGETILGALCRREQEHFSMHLSPLISTKEETRKGNGVNFNCAISAFPAVKAQEGAKEDKYAGIPIDGRLASGATAAYAPYVTTPHQHMQGVLNINLAFGDGCKRWEVWNLNGAKWVLWTKRGEMLWLPPGWFHRVTSYNGDLVEVRVKQSQS